ncbi:MAG: hypothetical protein HY985_18480, partial [Magnetospirillum sp.]|nr:hypothetical protein [Magnetospirillum sp.]
MSLKVKNTRSQLRKGVITLANKWDLFFHYSKCKPLRGHDRAISNVAASPVPGWALAFAVAVALLLSPAAQAQSQSDLDRAAREAGRLQRDEQDRLRREMEQQRNSARPPARIEIP